MHTSSSPTGETGIDRLPSAQAALLRRQDQVTSAATAGVNDADLPGTPDGVVEHGLDLRREIAQDYPPRPPRHPRHRHIRTGLCVPET